MDNTLTPEYRVHAAPATATLDDLYTDLETVPFPEVHIKELMGAAATTALGRFEGALQMPFATILIAFCSLSAFGLFRTVAMYTALLGVPPLPWLGLLGRKGDSKSIIIWLIKQAVLELQSRVNRRRRLKRKKAAAEKAQQPAQPASSRKQSRSNEAFAAHLADPAPPAGPAPPAENAGAQGDENDVELVDDDMVDEADENRKEPDASFTADTGTVYGWGAKFKGNGGRIMVALHEAKPLLTKIIHDSPGCDPQAFLKLFDRDEFSNTVLTAGSKFSEPNPWAVLFMAMHAEDGQELFGPGQDPLCI
jgi:hypothetical protein